MCGPGRGVEWSPKIECTEMSRFRPEGLGGLFQPPGFVFSSSIREDSFSRSSGSSPDGNKTIQLLCVDFPWTLCCVILLWSVLRSKARLDTGLETIGSGKVS